MTCYDCGAEFTTRHGLLIITDDLLGSIEVYLDEYYKCDNCGELMYPPGATKKIDDAEDRKRDELLVSNFYITNFISAATTAIILGMSRQGFHQHRKIRRGFIYRIFHEEKFWYLRESVELYKLTGDGRFPLASEPSITVEVQPQSSADFAAFLNDEQPWSEFSNNANYIWSIASTTRRSNGKKNYYQ